MKTTSLTKVYGVLRVMLLLGGATVLTQCGTVHSIDRTDDHAWNESGVWRLRPGSSTDYVPSDFSGPMLASAGQGTWVGDPQDEYRFYVPAHGTKKYPLGILQGEAAKATNQYTAGKQATRNTVRTVLFPAFAVAAVFDADNYLSGGGAGSYPDTSSYTDTTSSSNCSDHGGHGGDCHSSGGGGGGGGGGGHGK